MKPTLKLGARLILVVGVVVSLSGCRLGLDLRVDVEAGGGGRMAVALDADREALDAAEQAGADPLGGVVQAGRELEADGWTVSDVTAEDGTRRVELAVEAADAEELSAQAAQLADALSGPEAALLEPLTVALTEDRIAVDGAASILPGDAIADYGLPAADAVRLLQERDAFDYTVTITLPDEVLSSTATTVEGSTLTWNVQPGQRVTIAAEGVRPRFPLVQVAVGAAVIAAILLAVLSRRWNRQSQLAGR